MSAVTIEPFVAGQEDWGLLANLVECYREVFAEPPWNEWLACSVEGCGLSWGKPRAAELAAAGFVHCGQPVADYWPRAKVAADLRAVLNQGAVCWLAVERDDSGSGQVVGFTWGFPLAARWDAFAPELRESLRREFGDDPHLRSDIAYQSEVGVRASHRNRGLARQLTGRRHQDFLDRGFRVGIATVRESPEPSVTYLWYLRLGYRVIHRYPSESGRVVIGRALEPGLFDSRGE